jgi:hypothetical protein
VYQISGFIGITLLPCAFIPSLHFFFRSERENIFVFIGKNLDHDWLKSCFKACLVNDLRFKVGDLVQANIGEFVNGKVIKLWDDGNAYRIELDDGEKTNVFAPIDVDTYVRTRV